MAPYGVLTHFSGWAYGPNTVTDPIRLTPCSLIDPPPEVRQVKPYPGDGGFTPKQPPEYPGFPPDECHNYSVCEYGSWSNKTPLSSNPPTATHTGWMGFSSTFSALWARIIHWF